MHMATRHIRSLVIAAAWLLAASDRTLIAGESSATDTADTASLAATSPALSAPAAPIADTTLFDGKSLSAMLAAAPPTEPTAGADSSSASSDASHTAVAPAPNAAGVPEDTWWFQPSLALWLPGIKGTVGARGLSVDVDASFLDILNDSNSLFGISGSFQAGKGKLGAFVNGSYNKIGASRPTPFGTADLTNKIAILGFGVSYELGRWPIPGTARDRLPARDLILNVFAGGRYTSVQVDFDFAVLASRTQREDWVDPIVGASLDIPLSQSWSIVARGDVGGFGVASDLTWSAAGLISWDFHMKKLPASLQFGYLALGDDYSTGSGSNEFVWDTVLHGILVNFLVRF